MSDRKRLASTHDTMDLSKVPRRVADGQSEPEQTTPPPSQQQPPTQSTPEVAPNGVKVRQITRFGNRAKTPTLTLNKPLSPDQTGAAGESIPTAVVVIESSPPAQQSPHTTTLNSSTDPVNISSILPHPDAHWTSANSSFADHNASIPSSSQFDPLNLSTMSEDGNNNNNTSRGWGANQFDFEIEQMASSIKALDHRTSLQRQRLDHFGLKVHVQQSETLKAQQDVKEMLTDAQKQVEEMKALAHKAKLPLPFTSFLADTSNSLSTILTQTNSFISKSLSYTSRSRQSTSGSGLDASHAVSPRKQSTNWDSLDDETIVTPTKLPTELSSKSLDTSGDISFNLDDLGGTGFSPNRFRQQQHQPQLNSPPKHDISPFSIPASPQQQEKPSEVQVQQQQPQQPQPRRQLQNRFRDNFAVGKSKPTGPSFPTSPVQEQQQQQQPLNQQSQEVLSQQDLAKKFAEDNDFEDDDCFVKKPAAQTVQVTAPQVSQQDLAKRFAEDNDFEDDDCFVKKPPTPKAQPQISQQELAKKFAADNDFEDDDCFVKKPTLPKALPAVPQQISQQELAKKFAEDNDFEDDDCFVKKPAHLVPTVPAFTQEQLAKRFAEDNDFEEDECFVKKPPTPSAKQFAKQQQETQQELARKFAADNDFEDDDCFVKKPATPKAQPQISQQELAKKFAEDNDFEDDDCFVKKPVPLPPTPYPTDDFEEDDCVVTHYDTNAPRNGFADVFASYVPPEVDDILATLHHFDVPFEIEQKFVSISSDDNDNDYDRHSTTLDSQLAPGMNALAFMQGNDDDDDTEDEDESSESDFPNKRTLTFPSAAAREHEALEQQHQQPKKRRVHFTAPATSKRALQLKVLPYVSQQYEGYEYIRGYDPKKDAEEAMVEIEEDPYDSDLDGIDGQHNMDSTAHYQLETRSNTGSNTTPTLSPGQANRDWGFPVRLHGHNKSNFRYGESDTDEEDDYYSSSYGDYGTYQASYSIPPPLPDNDDVDPIEHQAKLMQLLYGQKANTDLGATGSAEADDQSATNAFFESSANVFETAQ